MCDGRHDTRNREPMWEDDQSWLVVAVWRSPAMRSIDLNSDLGESFGAYRIGYDDELFPMLSSANVACGFHGGDPRTLERTIAACRA
jgi:hypothetical protein